VAVTAVAFEMLDEDLAEASLVMPKPALVLVILSMELHSDLAIKGMQKAYVAVYCFLPLEAFHLWLL